MGGAHVAPRPFWQAALGEATKRTLRSACLFVLVVLVLLAARPLLQPTSPAAVSETQIQRLSRLHGCSPDGLPPGVVPKRAIVRDDHNSTVRLGSFDEGWAMYTGQRAGTLVAVCRD